LSRAAPGSACGSKLTDAQRAALVDDAGGNRLDAVLCLMRAG